MIPMMIRIIPNKSLEHFDSILFATKTRIVKRYEKNLGIAARVAFTRVNLPHLDNFIEETKAQKHAKGMQGA